MSRKILSQRVTRYGLEITLGSGKRQNANRTLTISRNLLEDHEPVGDRTELVRAVVDELRAALEAP